MGEKNYEIYGRMINEASANDICLYDLAALWFIFLYSSIDDGDNILTKRHLGDDNGANARQDSDDQTYAN